MNFQSAEYVYGKQEFKPCVLSCNYIADDSSCFYDILREEKKSINRFQTIQLFSNLLYSVIKLNSFCKTIDFWSLAQNCLVHRLKYPQNIANHLFILFSKFVSSPSYLQHRCILRVIHSLITKTIQVFLLNSLFQKSCYWHSHILP